MVLSQLCGGLPPCSTANCLYSFGATALGELVGRLRSPLAAAAPACAPLHETLSFAVPRSPPSPAPLGRCAACHHPPCQCVRATLVHIAKTAGETAASTLRAWGLLGSEVHMRPLTLDEALRGKLVITLRDPMDRVVSAFNWRHPSNLHADSSRGARVRLATGQATRAEQHIITAAQYASHTVVRLRVR